MAIRLGTTVSPASEFNVKTYGAIGDNAANDEPAITAAIAAAGVGGCVFFPNGTYRCGATVAPLAGQTLRGLGASSSIIVANHDNPAILIDTKNGVKIVGIGVQSVGAHINVTAAGVKLIASNYCRFDDVSVHYCDTGFLFTKECDWNIGVGMLVGYCENYGVRIQADGGVGANNNLTFTSINLNSATPGKDTYGIQTDGGVNLFVGGEISICRYPVGFKGTNNRLLSAYIESTEYGPKIDEGCHYIDSHVAAGSAIISSGAKLIGPSGQENSQYADFQQQRLSFSGIKSIHLFNEGSGTLLQDLSGNGNHVTTMGSPTWESDGMWGAGLLFDAGNSKGVSDFPLSAHDWTAPFTIASLIRIDSIPVAPGNVPIIAEFYQTGKYFRLIRGNGLAQAQNYDGATFSMQGWGTSSYTTPGDGKWLWTVCYIDPPNNQITALDPIYGTTAVAALPCNALTGVTAIHIGYSLSGGYYAVGRFGFLGIWNRKLSISEVYDLVNLKSAPVPQTTSVQSALVGALIRPDGTEMKFDVGASSPVSGAWPLGWVRYNSSPVAGGVIGWVCVVAGTPGTWKSFGAIST